LTGAHEPAYLSTEVTTKQPSNSHSSNNLDSGNLIAAILSLVYITVFIVVVAEYVHYGIRMLAYLGLIQLICTIIIIILTIIGLVHGTAATSGVAVGTGASVIVIIVTALTFLITILTIVYALKLAKDIEQLEHYHPV